MRISLVTFTMFTLCTGVCQLWLQSKAMHLGAHMGGRLKSFFLKTSTVRKSVQWKTSTVRTSAHWDGLFQQFWTLVKLCWCSTGALSELSLLLPLPWCFSRISRFESETQNFLSAVKSAIITKPVDMSIISKFCGNYIDASRLQLGLHVNMFPDLMEQKHLQIHSFCDLVDIFKSDDWTWCLVSEVTTLPRLPSSRLGRGYRSSYSTPLKLGTSSSSGTSILSPFSAKYIGGFFVRLG